jgi:ribosomal protein S18 acetylase RimI-like enzyme
MGPAEVEIRRLAAQDLNFLREMFVEPFSWREERPRPSLEQLLAVPELARYVADWGRPGDAGVLALLPTGRPISAAWYRLFDKRQPGYGFVHPDIPELGIATVKAYRGRGIGRILMLALIELARSEARPGLSLSVEEDNLRAMRLYEGLGFERRVRIGNAWTMLLRLA